MSIIIRKSKYARHQLILRQELFSDRNHIPDSFQEAQGDLMSIIKLKRVSMHGFN